MIFLWIDSLCIIHDDADDGKCEASKMAECYQNAVVTLSATDAMTCLGLQVGSLASSPSFGDFASAAGPPKVAAFCRLFGAHPAHPRDLD